MRKALIFTMIVTGSLFATQRVQAEYCYDLVGTTVCTEEPSADLADREAEYMQWVEEQSTISTPMPVLGPEVIGVLPGPLLEGTPSFDTQAVTDIGTPPIPPVSYEPAVRVPVPDVYWTCDVIAIF